ncbi:hypothetical protein QFC19_004320 [Naganishia cerealis]|uniref:Uncharacterized protein n=1 Tax=Naganishia cerealis TaxID=610337 RepID=A0ACC2VW49_9TREE|nr:hypothetical protein QFC19_004320 [Naganishia cerealis]
MSKKPDFPMPDDELVPIKSLPEPQTPDTIGAADEIETDLADDLDDNIVTPLESVIFSPDESEDTNYVEVPVRTRPEVSRHLSKNDAQSIVGGESMDEMYHSETSLVDVDRDADNTDKNDLMKNDLSYSQSERVFSFALPFGGLANIRSNISKHLSSFKRDAHLPSFSFNLNSHELPTPDYDLARLHSLDTLAEAEYFHNQKGTENVRFRAVKHSIATNINEFLPFNRKPKAWESIYNEIEGNIVILGGYRGSILRDARTRKRVWIPIKAGFNLRRINLLLGPSEDDELKATDLIYPDGILKNIGPIDICKKFIKKLQANPKTNVKEFSYDWRLSGQTVSAQLERFLKVIKKKTGQPTIVVAHSMGGLMTHGVVQRNPELFRAIIYVGSPSECLNILGPIRFGDSVLLSDKILTFETNFMMRSSFLFLPLSGRVFTDKKTGVHYDLDYFDPKTWVEYNLNPLVSSKRVIEETLGSSLPQQSSQLSINSIGSIIKNYRTRSLRRSKSPISEKLIQTSTLTGETLRSATESPDNLQPDEEHMSYSFLFAEAYDYLARTLKQAKEYLLGLEYNPELEPRYPPMAVVYGNKVPSVRRSIVEGIQDIKDGKYYEFYYGHGDGVVHQNFLMPEGKNFRKFDPNTGEGQIVGKFSLDCGHVSLMTDFRAMGEALRAVVDAEMIWPKVKSQDKIKSRKKESSEMNLQDRSSSEITL